MTRPKQPCKRFACRCVLLLSADHCIPNPSIEHRRLSTAKDVLTSRTCLALCGLCGIRSLQLMGQPGYSVALLELLMNTQVDDGIRQAGMSFFGRCEHALHASQPAMLWVQAAAAQGC